MSNEKKTVNTRKVYKSLAAVFAAGGIALCVLAAGTDDARMEASKEQEEKLASPKTTRTMAFAGLASMLAALYFQAKSAKQK